MSKNYLSSTEKPIFNPITLTIKKYRRNHDLTTLFKSILDNQLDSKISDSKPPLVCFVLEECQLDLESIPKQQIVNIKKNLIIDQKERFIRIIEAFIPNFDWDDSSLD